MIFDKDDLEQIMKSERLLFDAEMDLVNATQKDDFDAVIDDMDSVEYQALSAILKIKELKAKLGVEKDEEN
ncbi:hypothetical protein ACLUW9_05375 [Limosilactobacillus mucosae]|uniref:hypothetical protein n=1 Tax=Limosilactobacillus mucosae TaxID=97478 RepID=UPI00399499A5